MIPNELTRRLKRMKEREEIRLVWIEGEGSAYIACFLLT